MAINDLISKIILEDDFSDTFDKYEKRLTGADGQINKFNLALAKAATVTGTTTAAVVGTVAAINRLTDSAVQNQKEMFNVAYAAASANKEFGNSVGNVESWTESVRKNSDAMRVFGDQDVAAATTRLIDMTKRLGFTEQQMQTLLTRTGDLAAGKTDLEGAIERTSAAMRGEAESAEFLGLSLNENAVRAYAESHGVLWKNLSDTEKAQQRYNLFLEQTNTIQGRAAKSTDSIIGREAELARLRQRQIDDLGTALLPLREGELELLKKSQGEWFNLGDAVTHVFSAYQAFGVVAATVLAKAGELVKQLASTTKEAFDAIQSGDFSALNQSYDELDKRAKDFISTYGNLSGTFKDAYDQLYAENIKAKESQIELSDVVESSGSSYDRFASNAAAATQRVAEETEKLKMKQLDLTNTTNRRMADLEYQHGQRVIQIQKDIVRATAEAAAEAAAARAQSAAKLASTLADIERGLQQDKADAQRDFDRDIKRLAQQRKDAERDLRRGVRDINRDLQDDIKKLHADAENDKTKITESAADNRLKIEQKYADLRARVDDEYSSEFEGADAFRRKILTFNRDERLRQLDEQETAEQTALQSQTQTALTELGDRVAAEEAILNEQAQRKRDRLEEEFNDKKAALQRERDELTASLAEEQARRDEAAALARTKAEEQNAQELARIDQQEAEKKARAAEAIARENEQYQQRIADLQRTQTQERALIDLQLRALEAQRRASYLRQIQEAQQFARQMQQILSGLGLVSGGSGSLGDTLPAGYGGNNTQNVTVNNYGVPAGYQGAMQTARSILDIVNGGG